MNKKGNYGKMDVKKIFINLMIFIIQFQKSGLFLYFPFRDQVPKIVQIEDLFYVFFGEKKHIYIAVSHLNN